MPHEPAFMKDLEAFHRALAEVDSPAAWARFRERWFSDLPWPHRTRAEIDAMGPGTTVELGGRRFVKAPLPDDVSPDARYEYFAALAAGFAAIFPSEPPGAAGSRVRFHCPACEMWTDDSGPAECPACKRALLRMRVAPPR